MSFARCPVKMTVTYGVEKCPARFDDYRCSLSEKYRALALEQLREDDTLREQALEAMRTWIAKHPYIRRCRTDSLFLLRFLRQRKFSIPVACEMLERYLAMRQTFPQWFQNLDPYEEDLKELGSNDVFQALGFDEKGRIVILIKAKNFNVERFTLVHLMRYLHMYAEIMASDERIQVAGIVLVVDCFNTTMMHFTLFNLSDMKNMMPYINHLIPVRCKEIHVIRLPKMSVTLVDILLTFISPKLKQRFFVSIAIPCHHFYCPLKWGRHAPAKRSVRHAQRGSCAKKGQDLLPQVLLQGLLGAVMSDVQ